MSNVIFLAASIIVLFAASYGQQVRQCTCQEMEICHNEMKQRMQPCKQKCRAQVMGQQSNAVHQCFEQEFGGGHHGGGCFRSIRNQMCASGPGQMIDASETFQQGMMGGAGMGGGQGSGGLGGGFRQMMMQRMQNDGSDGKGMQFFQCMRQCGQEQGLHPGQCAQSLGCAVRRPAPEAFMQTMQQCRGEHMAKRQRMCQCLQAAGAGELCQQQGGGFGGGRFFG
ncbi:secreted protein [Aphelenchoides avenae]|nr:secreted protein [Aphelenchus avenae]